MKPTLRLFLIWISFLIIIPYWTTCKALGLLEQAPSPVQDAPLKRDKISNKPKGVVHRCANTASKVLSLMGFKGEAQKSALSNGKSAIIFQENKGCRFYGNERYLICSRSIVNNGKIASVISVKILEKMISVSTEFNTPSGIQDNIELQFDSHCGVNYLYENISWVDKKSYGLNRESIFASVDLENLPSKGINKSSNCEPFLTQKASSTLSLGSLVKMASGQATSQSSSIKASIQRRLCHSFSPFISNSTEDLVGTDFDFNLADQ